VPGLQQLLEQRLVAADASRRKPGDGALQLAERTVALECERVGCAFRLHADDVALIERVQQHREQR
jgi:hypothetical protein